MDRIYLDYNASAPLRPVARRAMLEVLDRERATLNASSVHYFGREGRKILEEARGKVASLVGVPAAQVVFASGATEANNTVIQHFSRHYPLKRILISAIEHPSVLKVESNHELIPVTGEGLVDLDALENLLSEDGGAVLVSVMAVNNETGAIQNLAGVSALARKYGAFVHSDAVQAAGRIPLNISEMGVDFLTLSSHKIGGPPGAGALVMGLCGETPTLIFGGGQERGARAGTENLPAIAGFGAAAQESLERMNHYQALGSWRDRLEQDILKATPDAVIHAKDVARVANTSLFSLPGVSSETLLMALDLEGVAISNGAACSSGRVEPSHVLTAMGASREIASSALRISLGWATKESDLTAFINAWTKVCARLNRNHSA
ncbi:MAG: cysteine desulfurase [Alphaproteobacteria bacterium]|nr:cysteine desulfurase [Alphaproteobacteria bacterium]MCB9975702.1 cysteine desulfurase [Rhodospirillales bacterium]